jgi:hypothetical protein
VLPPRSLRSGYRDLDRKDLTVTTERLVTVVGLALAVALLVLLATIAAPRG